MRKGRSTVVSIFVGLAMVAAPIVAVAPAAYASGTFSNTASIGLNNPSQASTGTAASLYPSTISVSGQTGTVSSLTVTLSDINYSYMQDLDFLLVAPTGASMVVMAGVGSNDQVSNQGDTHSLGLTIEDSSPSTYAYNAEAPVTGTVSMTPRDNVHNSTDDFFDPPADTFPSPAPAGPYAHPASYGSATLDGTFDGVNPNGTWSLYAITTQEGDGTGSVGGGWSLSITTSSVDVSTTTSLTSSQNPSFTSGADSSVTLTATVTASGSPVTAGTVAFTDGGTTIGSCGAVALNGSGQAQCATTFTTEGDHALEAAYSGGSSGGDTYITSNGTLTQDVNNQTTVNGNTFCNSASGISIPDNTNEPPGEAVPYPSEIFVSGLTGTVAQVSAGLTGVTYPYSQDLEVLLVGPAGGSLVLMSNVGPSSAPGAAADGVNLAFSDSASSLLPESSTVVSGSYQPSDYGTTDGFPAPAPATLGKPAPTGTSTLAQQFDATNPNGAWSLYVITDSPGDGMGEISGGWCLTVTTGSQALTSTSVTSSLSPSFTANPGNDVTFTATVTQGSSPVTAGNVSFTSDGANISGCSSEAVDSSGQATCPTSFSAEGDYTVEAAYGATASFGPSDATVTQEVDKHTVVVAPNEFANDGTITLNNPISSAPEAATPYPSHIYTSNLGPVTGLTVTLDGISYPYAQDIQVLLVGPQGQSIVLLSNVGPDTGTVKADNVSVTFSDAAGSQIPQSTPLGSPNSSVTTKPVAYVPGVAYPAPAPSGYSYASPEGSASLSGSFNGTNPNGTWSLYVVTDGAGDGTGTIGGGWSIDFAVASQTVSFSSVAPAQGLIGSTYPASVSATPSGLPVTYSIDGTSTSGACSVNATTGLVSFLAAGSCVVDAAQAGDGNWSAATTVSQTIPVVGVPGAPTSLVAMPGNGQVTLNWAAPLATNGSPLQSYNIYEGISTGGEGAAPVANVLVAAGTTDIISPLTNGTKYYFEVTAVNGAGGGPVSNEASATPEAPATTPQTLSFTSSPPTTGTTGETGIGQTYVPTAKSTSGLLVALSIDGSSAGACSMSAGKVTFTGVGTCTIDANQGGGSGYALAAQVQQKVTVHAVAQTTTTLTANAATVPPGSNITYTLAVANSGPGAASDVSVTLFLPAGVTLVSASGSPSSQSSSAVQWTAASIAASSSATYTVIVKVNAATTGSLTASAWAYPYAAGSIDPNAGTAYAAITTKT